MAVIKKVERKIKKIIAIMEYKILKRTIIYEDDNGVTRIVFGKDVFDDIEELASLFDY